MSCWTKKPLWTFIQDDYVGTNDWDNDCYLDVPSFDQDGLADVVPTPLNPASNANHEGEGEQVAMPLREGETVQPQSYRDSSSLSRHLTLFDLVSIGVGGTIGSGIFVLCGLVAHERAGPAVILSWLMAGGAAFLSGCCYAELSGRIPTTGSGYAYAYVSMGELPAFLMAACLTLEFMVSGAAVARSWGNKIVEWLKIELGVGKWVETYLDPGWGVNPCACIISVVCTCILLTGVKESKFVTGVFTWIKLTLVLFMTILGFVLLQPSNLTPFIPPEFGINGITRGATSLFFGYVGYDGICCMAGEAKDPRKNLPRGVLVTLVIVTIMYVLASFALVGMVPYGFINVDSAFPDGFAYRGVIWAAQLTAAGEIITLPIVVLIALMLQPRLQYALAKDGLLPKLFCEIKCGLPFKGTAIAGFFMTIIATFVPFKYLDDFVSAGILLAFSVTNSSLVLLRRRSPNDRQSFLERHMVLFNGLAFITSVILVRFFDMTYCCYLALFLVLMIVIIVFRIWWYCPPIIIKPLSQEGYMNKLISTSKTDEDTTSRIFTTPFVPFLPCLGSAINWYLIAQLEVLGIFLLIVYVALFTMIYFSYSIKNSIGNNGGWGSGLIQH